MNNNLSCPRCQSNRLNKFGFIWSGRNRRQRWVCLSCHRVTLHPLGEIKNMEAPTVNSEASINCDEVKHDLQ